MGSWTIKPVVTPPIFTVPHVSESLYLPMLWMPPFFVAVTVPPLMVMLPHELNLGPICPPLTVPPLMVMLPHTLSVTQEPMFTALTMPPEIVMLPHVPYCPVPMPTLFWYPAGGSSLASTVPPVIVMLPGMPISCEEPPMAAD